MKKTSILSIYCIFLLAGCSKQNNILPEVVTTTTAIEITEPKEIVHLDGIDDKKLKSYLENFWIWYEGEEENIYRYWERGNDYPEGTVPKETWGMWLDFNQTEYYEYWDPDRIASIPREGYDPNRKPTNIPVKKLVYNWTKDTAQWGDTCFYDYKTDKKSGECDNRLPEDLFLSLKIFFESRVEAIKNAG